MAQVVERFVRDEEAASSSLVTPMVRKACDAASLVGCGLFAFLGSVPIFYVFYPVFMKLWVSKWVLWVSKQVSDFSPNNWCRVHKIEEFLNITFNPKDINDSREDEIDVEKLYLLLLKGEAIRQNLKDVTHTINYSDEFDKTTFEEGNQLRFANLENFSYKIYGTEFCIYVVSIIYNFIISSVVDNPKTQNYVIKSYSTDSQPMYSVYKGFKAEYEANQELEKIKTDTSLFENAKTFNELMEEQKGNYYSAIREKS